MGSHHSVRIPFNEDKKFGDQQNKLTKPRTYSNATVTRLPSLSFSGSKLALLGSSKILPPKENVSQHAGVSGANRQSSATLHSHINDFNPTADNSHDSNPITRVSEGNASNLQTVTSLPLRRRSTLRAAPPATISRKPENPPIPVVEIESTPTPLATPDTDSSGQRYITHSDYSVIKRGCLRVTNASPTPSSRPGSPLPTPNLDGLATCSERACESSHRTSEDMQNGTAPHNSTRVFPQSRCPCLSAARSLSSCQGSPALGCLCIHDNNNRPLPNVPGPPDPSQKHGVEQSMSLSRITMSPKDIFDDIARRQQAYITAVRNAHSLRKPTVLQHPMNITTYSGYSSTESVTSWQTCESRFTTEITAASMATFDTVNNAANSEIKPDRYPTIVTLESGIYSPAAQTACNESLPSLGELGTTPTAPPNKRQDEEHTALVDQFSVSQPSSSSHRGSDSSLSAEILDKITGQVYYQRFSRRRSQLENPCPEIDARY